VTFVSRAALRQGVTAFVRESPAMRSLDDGLRVLYPGQRRPSVHSMAELVLLSIVRGHERHTQGVLGRINEALARLLDDLDALRAGRSIEGRTAALRTRDLTTIAQAMEDLRKLEDQVRFLLENEPSWAGSLRSDLSAALAGPPRPVRRPVTFRPTAPPRPQTPRAAAGNLRRALLGAGADPYAVIASGRPPNAVLRAAHRLVVAAGGDVAAAVRALRAQGGRDLDAMITAVLLSEGRIYRGAPLPEGPAWAAHQREVTGLGFEWSAGPGTAISRRTLPPDPTLPPRAPLPPGALGEEIGIDGIVGGFLVDAKSGRTPLEVLTSRATELPPWRRDVEPGIDVEIREAAQPRRVDIEAQRLKYEDDLLREMSRQIAFAQHNGLGGVKWVCTSEELAAAFRVLAHRLPAGPRLNIHFVVGGLR
jgi:hypothetical protein